MNHIIVDVCGRETSCYSRTACSVKDGLRLCVLTVNIIRIHGPGVVSVTKISPKPVKYSNVYV